MTVEHKVVEQIRQRGPSTAKELIDEASPNDMITNWDVEQVENYLDGADVVTLDDSGRYHLTDAYKESEFEIKQVVMVPRWAKYEVREGELVEVDISEPLIDQKGFHIDRNQPYDIFDPETGEQVTQLPSEEAVIDLVSDPYEGLDKSGEYYTCEWCQSASCVAIPSSGCSALKLIDNLPDNPKEVYQKVECEGCATVLYEAEE